MHVAVRIFLAIIKHLYNVTYVAVSIRSKCRADVYGPYTWCAWTAAETIAKVDADNNATQIGPDNVSHCGDAAV